MGDSGSGTAEQGKKRGTAAWNKKKNEKSAQQNRTEQRKLAQTSPF
jgi:hypothetical protein